MVLRVFLLLVLSLPLFSQTIPRMTLVRYTGNGTADASPGEREIATAIDQEITFVMVTGDPNPGDEMHPGYFYVRTRTCDDFVGTHGSTGADADSVSFFSSTSGSIQSVIPDAIKRWSNDTVIVGRQLDKADTSYWMWVVSDPDSQALFDGIYVGDGVDARTITVGAPDSIRGMVIMPGINQTSRAHATLWVWPNTAIQYMGERGADITSINPATGDIVIPVGSFAYMNNNNQWYTWFAFLKSALYVEGFNYTGNSTANSADTLTFTRSGYKPFLIFGTNFTGASVTDGTIGSAAYETSPNDTTWNVTATTSVDIITGASSAILKVKADSMILKNAGKLDVNTKDIGVITIGDTVFYSPPATETDTRRQPCQGEIQINNNGNVEIIDRY
jgi:hypothetical protein